MFFVNSSRAWVLATTLMIGFSTTAWAQDQPAGAFNQQDEVVTINLAPGEGADRVLQILRSGDKFEINDYITRAFELSNTSAYEMRFLIRDAVGREKGTVRSIVARPPGGGATRQFLVVTTTPAQMETIAETISQLDIQGLNNSQGSTRAAVRVRYRRASDLVNVIANTRATGQSKLFADDLTNTIYYDDSESVVRSMDSYVQFFDVPIPQVEFDVQIIEVREADIDKVGLDWDAWKRSIGGQLALTANQFEGGQRFARLDTLLTLDASVLANFLNYTVQTGSARLAQRSRLNASNLEPAVISDVRRVPFHDYQRTERAPVVVTERNPRVDTSGTYAGDEADADRVRTVTIAPPVHNRLVDLSSEYEGLLVSIQPVIGTDMVTARIDIAMNTMTGFDRADRPIVTEQNLENIVTLQNGEEILLGTLERQNVTESRRGIPLLKDIPVVRYLFSVESRAVERSRVFIVATPKYGGTRFAARSIAEVGGGQPVLQLPVPSGEAIARPFADPFAGESE